MKLPTKLQAEARNHRKPREETGTARYVTFERSLSTILLFTCYLDPWERMLRTPIDPRYNAGRRACLKSARRTLPQSKRHSQRRDLTNGRCQLFYKTSQSAEIRGSGKLCSRPCRCQPKAPDDATHNGRPWENQEMQRRR